MEKRQKSFVQGAAILGVAGLLVKIIGAVFRIPLANQVGPEGMSYYEVAYPYYSGLLVIASSGLPTAISKMVSERVTLKDYRGARDVFNTARALLCVLGVVLALVMFFLAKPLASSSGLDAAYLSFQAFAPALLFVAVMCAYRGYLQGLQQMTGTAVSQIVEQLGKLVIGLTLAIKLLPKGPEYAAMGAIIGVSVSELMALIVICVMYRAKKRSFDAKLKRGANAAGRSTNAAGRGVMPERRGFGSISKNLLQIAVPVTIGASISPLAGIVDVALIINILTETLGFNLQTAQTAFSLLRTNVSTLVNMPGVLTMALAMSLVPAVAANAAKKDIAGVRATSRLGLKLALIIGVPCAVGLFVLAEPILHMLYPTLKPAELTLAADLLHTASVGVIFLSMVQSMTGVLQGLGKPQVPVINLFIGAVLKVAAMVIMMRIPSLNIQGAAVSTVILYAYAGVADTIYMMRRTRMRAKVVDTFLKPLFASSAMGLAAYLVNRFLIIENHANITTLLAVGAGVAVYAALVILLKMFSSEELNYIPGGGKLRRIMYRGEHHERGN